MPLVRLAFRLSRSVGSPLTACVLDSVPAELADDAVDDSGCVLEVVSVPDDMDSFVPCDNL